MVSQPHGISPRIMKVHLQLQHGRSMVLISAYAPTLIAADDDKEPFYDFRSKHWHVLDYIITRQRHISEVHVTRAMTTDCCGPSV